MGKHVAVSVVAAAATLFAAQAFAQEVAVPMTRFFVAIPLDARNAKEQVPNFGLQFQGSRPYQSVQVDYQSVKFLPAAIAGLEAKYVVAGAVAIAATIAATRKSKSEQAAVQQFHQQQAEQQAACPVKTC